MDNLPAGSVMVGVDGSVGSDLAVLWSANYAKANRRPLALVHVVVLPVVVDLVLGLSEADEDLHAAGRQMLDRSWDLVHAAQPDLPVSRHLATGDPRQVLAELADGACLLALGNRGLGTVASLLLGSVSVALAVHSPCAVATVRHYPESVASVDLSVVVGVDGTPDSAEALEFAFEQASEENRPLEVLHALGTAWAFPYPDAPGPEVREEAMQDWKLLVSESLAGYVEKFPDVAVRPRVVQGSATQALVGASETASVVVVGSRGRGARGTIMGSVSRSVVEHAHSTVVVVRGHQT